MVRALRLARMGILIASAASMVAGCSSGGIGSEPPVATAHRYLATVTASQIAAALGCTPQPSRSQPAVREAPKPKTTTICTLAQFGTIDICTYRTHTAAMAAVTAAENDFGTGKRISYVDGGLWTAVPNDQPSVTAEGRLNAARYIRDKIGGTVVSVTTR